MKRALCKKTLPILLSRVGTKDAPNNEVKLAFGMLGFLEEKLNLRGFDEIVKDDFAALR
jgi:hypothetical protein